MMDLSADIVGTNPQYPSLVDHSWLSVDTKTYDNYPSDNNSVRVIPKLSELWRTNDANISLSPTTGCPFHVGPKASEKNPDIIREAKKVLMAGMSIKKMAAHIRSLFSSSALEAVKEDLAKLSSEIGLLGNVYIDASAFKTMDEAEKFLMSHRNRLARDILFDAQQMNASVVNWLAAKFRKNAVTEVKYDTGTLSQYKDHLIRAGLIPEDLVVDSKETLRQAFMYQAPQAAPVIQKQADCKKISSEQIQEGLSQMAQTQGMKLSRSEEALVLARVLPIVSYVQEQLSKGKDRVAVKEMLRGKYASEDLVEAAPYIAAAVSGKGLYHRNIDELVKTGSLSDQAGEALKKIGSKFPISEAIGVVESSAPRLSSSVMATAQTVITRSNQMDSYRKAALAAISKGISIERIAQKLESQMSQEEASKVIGDVIGALNASPAGFVANTPKKQKVTYDVQALDPQPVLPDPLAIPAQTQEMVDFFKGASTDVQVDSAHDAGNLVMETVFSHEGLDGIFKSK